ncbi:hypothetical protein NMY22_g12844 [Coprinellus aureogranulatus]|nr:hypothetical protein NMY22_g12844 [Coprinellus aureogranulatus]
MASRLARTTVLGEASPCPSPKPKDTIQSLVDDLTTPDAGSFKEQGVPSKATKFLKCGRGGWRKTPRRESAPHGEYATSVLDNTVQRIASPHPTFNQDGWVLPSRHRLVPEESNPRPPIPLAFSKGRTVITRRAFGI